MKPRPAIASMLARKKHVRFLSAVKDVPRTAGECAWCGTPILGNKKHCSLECKNEVRIRSNYTSARRIVFARDRGICSECGDGGRWCAHHIVSVSVGGGCCGLNNYATLCTVCHKKKKVVVTGKSVEKEGRWRRLLAVRLHKRVAEVINKRAHSLGVSRGCIVEMMAQQFFPELVDFEPGKRNEHERDE